MSTQQVADLLRQAKRILAVTGAGISSESGVPTFRGAGGLWGRFCAEDLATPEAFARDPELVWRCYDERRQDLALKSPNPGHTVLAGWEKRWPDFQLITQTVDGLHQLAGSKRVIPVHGNIWEMRCVDEGSIVIDRSVPLSTIPPRCSRCHALLRPNVVWFGEPLPAAAMATINKLLSRCQALLVIGTSAMVYPVAEFPLIVKKNGGRVIEINTEATPLTGLADYVLQGRAGEILPEIDHAL